VTDQRGFTLTELLIVIAILGMMLGALFTLQQQGQVAYMIGSARVEVQQNGRIALDMLAREIRLATNFDPFTKTQVSTSPILYVDPKCGTAAGGSWIAFAFQTDGVTAAGQQPKTVKYQLVGEELRRAEGNPPPAAIPNPGTSDVLINGVKSLTMLCYDGSNVLTAVVGDIRQVDIRIETKIGDTVASYSPKNQHSVVQARVRLRNSL
jgi:prepilin-type N-terminal cleavage/methylation domain-containing protein